MLTKVKRIKAKDLLNFIQRGINRGINDIYITHFPSDFEKSLDKFNEQELSEVKKLMTFRIKVNSDIGNPKKPIAVHGNDYIIFQTGAQDQASKIWEIKMGNHILRATV